MEIGKASSSTRMAGLRPSDIPALNGELPVEDGILDTIENVLGSSPRNASDSLINGPNIEIILIILTLVT